MKFISLLKQGSHCVKKSLNFVGVLKWSLNSILSLKVLEFYSTLNVMGWKANCFSETSVFFSV